VLGAGAGATPTPMASLGTTTTVLHGNASGAPTFGAVSLTADVTGTLPTANGGTNLTSFTSGGVVYASSSSALATSSSLTYDGTFTVAGGSVMARFKTGSATDGRIELAYNATDIGYINMPSASLLDIYARSGVSLAFGANGSEGMRLTSTGLGIGTSSPAAKLQVQTGNIYVNNNGSALLWFNSAGNGAGIQNDAAGVFSLAVGNNVTTLNTPALTWLSNGGATNGNVGIGTNSPGAKLEVNRGTTASANATGATTRANSVITLAASSDTNTRTMFGIDTNTNGWVQVQNISSNSAADFIINPVGGNLGLGVTPSASSFTTMQIKNASLSGWASDLSAMFLTANTRYDGTNFRYISPSFACQYRQQSGDHYWYNAPSGTAGDPITFTQAMTLDGSGNLIVGGTSPFSSSSGRGNISINGTDSVLAFGNSAVSSAYIYCNTSNFEVSAIGSRYINFLTSGTERARITSAGDVGIGTTTPAYKLQVANSSTNVNTAITGSGIVVGSGLAFREKGASNGIGGGQYAVQIMAESSYGDIEIFHTGPNFGIVFGTNSTEKARIDNSGNLLVNTTSSTASTGQTAKLQVAGGIRTTTGFTSSISLGTIAQNATTTAAVGFGGVWLISNGYDTFALINITLSGGGVGTKLIFSTGTDIVCGTTSEPSGGTYLRLWVSGGVLQVKNVNAYTGPWFLTPLATFGS
jgi:hypothetical protein